MKNPDKKNKNTRIEIFIKNVEKIGNKFPHPFVLFIFSTIAVLVIAHILDGTVVKIPGEDKILSVNSLLNREGFAYMLTNILKNFADFPLIPLIISLTLAIGVGEKAGLYRIFIQKAFRRVSDKQLTFIFMFVAINSNLISDAALILMPTIGAILYQSRGRNPMIGIILSYTGFLAGLSANVLIAGTDALTAGITQTVIPLLKITRNTDVHAASNWYFMLISAFLLAYFGSLIADKVLEPMLNKDKSIKWEESKDLVTLQTTPEENRGLRWAGITTVVFIGVTLILLLPGGFLRDHVTDTILPNSPFIKSIIPILTFFFLSIGIMYGLGAKTIKSSHDIAKFMASGVNTITGVLIVFLFAAQFIDYFSKTNLATLIAIKGAEWLQTNNLTGIPLLVGIVVFVSIINFVVGTVGAKWAMLAPVLVPMLALLGYHPAFAQCVYRIGDAVTNTINPLSVYLPLILGFMKKYKKSSGIGTVIAYQIPFAITFSIVWTLLLIIWYVLKLPIGPTSPVLL